jgi:hypothetical protein
LLASFFLFSLSSLSCYFIATVGRFKSILVFFPSVIDRKSLISYINTTSLLFVSDPTPISMTATTEHFLLQDLALNDPSKIVNDMEVTDVCMCCQPNAQQQQSAKSFVLCKQCKTDLAYSQQAYLFYTQSPIHHTLSNATITYDSMYRDVHEYVKRDVFLAPAPPAAAESDSDYETVSTPIMVQQEDPAFLLEEAHSLFGVDGLLSQKLHKHSALHSLGIVKDKKELLEDLPTPPAALSDSEDAEPFMLCSRKRKRSATDLASRVDTPPTSPIFVTVSDPLDQDQLG